MNFSTRLRPLVARLGILDALVVFDCEGVSYGRHFSAPHHPDKFSTGGRFFYEQIDSIFKEEGAP
jgi:hypothetical protein